MASRLTSAIKCIMKVILMIKQINFTITTVMHHNNIFRLSDIVFPDITQSQATNSAYGRTHIRVRRTKSDSDMNLVVVWNTYRTAWSTSIVVWRNISFLILITHYFTFVGLKSHFHFLPLQEKICDYSIEHAIEHAFKVSH